LAVVADAFGGASPLGPLDKEGRPPPGTSPRTFARYIAAYTETLRVDPSNIEARSGRATKYRWLAEMTENEAESRRYYEASLKDAQDLAKQDVGFLAMSADLHRRLSQWDEAISAIDRLVESDPDTKYPRMTRGWALAAKGEWTRALEDLNAVIDEHRSGPDEWLRVRGIVHANLGNLEEALADFSAAYDSAATTASIARSFVTDPDLAKYKAKAEALKDAEQAEGYADMLMKLRDVVAEIISKANNHEKKVEKKKKGRNSR
jgi:tetratricopeptide (TPR) repeat protein